MDRMGRNHLIMPPRFSLRYFDPPKDLERYVLTLFHFACDAEQILDRQPGAVGQLVLFPRGEGEVELAGKSVPISGEAFMLSGFSRAGPFHMRGPWHAIGASLSPLGWAALTQAPASDHIDRFFPPEELLGEDFVPFARATNTAYRAGEIEGEDVCNALCAWIAPRLGPILPAHEALIQHTLDWLGTSLSPAVDDLFRWTSYSRRQTERLVERYFGLPPAALARKYRAVRAAALLGQGTLSGPAQAAIAEAFHDQPHMIREIRRYCGRTPSRLGGVDDPILRTMLQMKNFRRLHLFDGLE